MTTALNAHLDAVQALADSYRQGWYGERIPLQVQLSAGFTAWHELVQPLTDAADPPPVRRYGPQWYFVLRGPAGAVTLEAGRHRLQPGVCSDCRRYPAIRVVDQRGDCWHTRWLDRHATHPRWEEERPSTSPCPFLDRRPCYADGSPLQAEHLTRRWLADGGADEALVAELREYYTAWLGER